MCGWCRSSHGDWPLLPGLQILHQGDPVGPAVVPLRWFLRRAHGLVRARGAKGSSTSTITTTATVTTTRVITRGPPPPHPSRLGTPSPTMKGASHQVGLSGPFKRALARASSRRGRSTTSGARACLSRTSSAASSAPSRTRGSDQYCTLALNPTARVSTLHSSVTLVPSCCIAVTCLCSSPCKDIGEDLPYKIQRLVAGDQDTPLMSVAIVHHCSLFSPSLSNLTWTQQCTGQRRLHFVACATDSSVASSRVSAVGSGRNIICITADAPRFKDSAASVASTPSSAEKGGEPVRMTEQELIELKKRQKTEKQALAKDLMYRTSQPTNTGTKTKTGNYRVLGSGKSGGW